MKPLRDYFKAVLDLFSTRRPAIPAHPAVRDDIRRYLYPFGRDDLRKPYDDPVYRYEAAFHDAQTIDELLALVRELGGLAMEKPVIRPPSRPICRADQAEDYTQGYMEAHRPLSSGPVIPAEEVVRRVQALKSLFGSFHSDPSVLRNTIRALPAVYDFRRRAASILLKEFFHFSEQTDSLFRLADEWISAHQDAVFSREELWSRIATLLYVVYFEQRRGRVRAVLKSLPDDSALRDRMAKIMGVKPYRPRPSTASPGSARMEQVYITVVEPHAENPQAPTDHAPEAPACPAGRPSGDADHVTVQPQLSGELPGDERPPAGHA